MGKNRELQLRIRGLEEEEEEDIRGKVVNLFSELVEQTPIDQNVDQIFRIKSTYAECNKISRNVVVSVTTKKIKDEILKQHF